MSRKSYSKEELTKIFEKAKISKNHDPKLYRLDPYGILIYRWSYGKMSSMGWQVDHDKPVSKGGSNNIRNLQALQSHKNLSKGNSMLKKSRQSKCNQ